VTRITDPAAKPTDYLTDDLGRLVKVVSPDSGTTLYLHDLAGNTTSKVEAFGTGSARTTIYAYDGLDRLTLVNHPNDPDWVFTYDGSPALNQKGRLASVANGIVTTSFEYTARGDVALERTALDGKSYVVGYAYDAAGTVASVTGPSGVVATTSYQGLRPKTVAITAGTQTETIRNLEFLPFGGRKRADFSPYNGSSNVVLSTRSYNLRGQITEIDVTAPTGTILDRSLTYDYTAGSPGPNDPGPNLDRIVDNRDSSQSRFYFYDDLDRLASAKTLAGATVEGYLYDAVGNRTQKTTAAGMTTYSYESGTDRLSVATGPEAERYAHDAYGSRIYMGGAPYAGTPSLIYNDENRLVQAKDADAGFATLGQYVYDAFGRRVKKIAGGETELFFYDLAGHTIEILEVKAGTDRVRDLVFVEDEPVGFVDQDLEVGTALGPVAFELDGRRPGIPVGIALGALAGLALLAIPALRRRPKSAAAIALAAVAGGVSIARSQGGGAAFYWIHTDHLGTPLAVTNTPPTPTQATAVWRASYAPFGEATVDEDPDGDTSLVSLSFRFPGQIDDGETGLHYNLHRYFDPAVGRYISADPIGQLGLQAGSGFSVPTAGVNVYTYALANPLRWIDPLGLYGTNDCSYYGQRCAESGGDYYCSQAPYWCEQFPKPDDPDPSRDDDYEGWSRCTRQCLQDCDAAENASQDTCPIDPDDRKGPWDPRSESASCHVRCYAQCNPVYPRQSSNPFE
jgi:RHS repeat-associated protein